MLETLKRRSAVDPENNTLALNVVAAMAREGRSSELVAPLMDRDAWNKAGAHAQLLAGMEAHRRLGGDWDFKGMRVWSCGNRAKKETFDLTTTISHRLATFVHTPTGIDFQLLPGFTHREDPVIYRNEPFLIARWPVTNSQAWRTHQRNGLGEDGMYDTDAAKGPLPATGASFDEVKEYAKSNGLSLPSPDQWEYACKAGSTTRFYFGDELDPSHVWYSGNSGVHSNYCSRSGKPHSSVVSCCPGKYDPHAPAEHDRAGKWNAFGLVDMIGGLWEFLSNGQCAGGSFDSQENHMGLVLDNSGPATNKGFRPVFNLDWRFL